MEAAYFSTGDGLQRLFSTFPNGRPGAGLVVLRLATGIRLLIGSPEIHGLPQAAVSVLHMAVIGAGVFLLAGLWTPFMGAIQAIFELWIAFSSHGDGGFHLVLAALGVSLIMLGPGAWSVDAQLFGRKRIEIRGR
jgi:putative oxidoreductase